MQIVEGKDWLKLTLFAINVEFSYFEYEANCFETESLTLEIAIIVLVGKTFPELNN